MGGLGWEPMSGTWNQLDCVLNTLCCITFMHFSDTFITYHVEDSTLGSGQDTKVKMGYMTLGSFHSTREA